MENIQKPSLLKKISVTLLVILGSAGIKFFFDAFRSFSPNKADQILWILLFGISFAYIIDYKLEITPWFKFPGKRNDQDRNKK